MDLVRAHVVVRGLVQGVFFRREAADRALVEGVQGWIRNAVDGSVEAVFEGREEGVRAMLVWCHLGPSGARVDEVSVRWGDASGDLRGFEIR